MNYLYLGAIRRALPGARLVLLRRDPLDSCFAMYRTLFASAYPFSYDLREVARYYCAYQRLIDYWRSLLGEALFVVQYEQLVEYPKRRRHPARKSLWRTLGWAGACSRATHCGIPNCERSPGAQTYLWDVLRPLASLPQRPRSDDRNAARVRHCSASSTPNGPVGIAD